MTQRRELTVLARLVVVIRAGDQDDYHEFATLADAAAYLRDMAQIEMPAALTGDMRVEAVNYRGDNYISAFWGRSAEDPVRSITPSEWLRMADMIDNP